MLKQIIADILPHWIKDNINALAPCVFCGGDEIGIARYEDYPFDQSLESQRCDIQSDSHIDTLLTDIVVDIGFGQLGEFPLPG